MDAPLCGTSLTGRKIEELIRNYGKVNLAGHKLTDIEANVAGESEGFTSKLLRVALKWSPEGELPTAIVVKVIGSTALAEVMNASLEETLDQLLDDIVRAHDTECSVYEFPGLADVVPMPKCFGAERNVENHGGLLILEDLSPRAAMLPMRTFGLGLSEAQLEDTLDALASAHAWSLNTDVDWKAVLPPAADSLSMTETFTKEQRRFYDASAQAYPHVFEKLDRSKFDELLTLENYREIFCSDPMAKYGLPTVLTHGDIHTMNMLFEKKNSDEVGDRLVALIDWQVTHQGCGIEDIIGIFTLCMSKEMSRAKKDAVLERYAQLFNRKVNNPRDRITLENVKKAFNAMYSFTGILYLCCLCVQDSFMEKMKNATQEEKEVTKERMNAISLAGYEDAVKILGW